MLPPSMRELLHGAAASSHEANPAPPEHAGFASWDRGAPLEPVELHWVPLASIGLNWSREEVGGGGRMRRRREGWREGRGRKEQGGGGEMRRMIHEEGRWRPSYPASSRLPPNPPSIIRPPSSPPPPPHPPSLYPLPSFSFPLPPPHAPSLFPPSSQ